MMIAFCFRKTKKKIKCITKRPVESALFDSIDAQRSQGERGKSTKKDRKKGGGAASTNEKSIGICISLIFSNCVVITSLSGRRHPNTPLPKQFSIIFNDGLHVRSSICTHSQPTRLYNISFSFSFSSFNHFTYIFFTK